MSLKAIFLLPSYIERSMQREWLSQKRKQAVLQYYPELRYDIDFVALHYYNLSVTTQSRAIISTVLTLFTHYLLTLLIYTSL